jgi:hypothetical protein
MHEERRFQPHFNRGIGGVFAHNLGLAHSELPFWDSLFYLLLGKLRAAKLVNNRVLPRKQSERASELNVLA